MSDDEAWPRLIKGLRDGDPVVVRDFCNQYGEALHRLADKHLAEGIRRRVGPEDVVQSACRTFLRRAQGGEFQLADSESLWAILCAITLTKVREQARFHLRQKRGLNREVPIDSAPADKPGWDLVDPNPTPDQAAALAEQLEQVLATLNEEERQLVDLKLQEFTNDEVAARMGCSERTVRRILKRVQGHLANTLGWLVSNKP
jgi:RNA polymerase sigma factor (sigma-70 family)